MIKLYHAPMTRSARVRWLLEELELPYTLERFDFTPPSEGFYAQKTPMGKFPVIEDEGEVICESGAILEYIQERYGAGRLAPAIGEPMRGRYLQWIHFAEGTVYPPIGTLIFHTFYRRDAEQLPSVMADARDRAGSALDFLERHMGAPWVLGETFSAADVMLGYTLVVARFVGVLEGHSELVAYLARLEERPAFQRAAA